MATHGHVPMYIKQMIKVLSKVKAHFSLIRPGVFGHQTGAQQAAKIQPFQRSGSPNLDHM